jgi:cellulose synthase/poly-beta-1,6-N-acetylglucosamine synthase-like glycosyltransferase
VNFLNRNANQQIERSALAILRASLKGNPALGQQLARYLSAKLLPALGLEPLAPPSPVPARREHPNLPLLYLFLALGAGLVPMVCAVLAIAVPAASPAAHGVVFGFRFLWNFNAAFTVYALALNGVYLLLLGFSAAGVVRQAAQSDLLRLSFLFKQHILPSISIITPAFNEEASIVESVSSLLNLRYPDYEVIVVNDGSKDRTLERLVTHFELQRTDLFVHGYLNTQEIRGLYANKRYPELLVIDKENGGKADSLNAGINVARKEYFAGMDADSMLERDALLNLAGLFLFSEEEVVAAGGNILPVNGCTVRRGTLVSTRVPGRPIARFQTIEYLRAFMAGRVGWAVIKTLLIISGAFGVFHRQRVVDAHGYLTRSEHYMKDTVGEDMELVVRLTRGLRESGIRYSVQYAHHANCWTEIPERMKVLNRQRDRWQRGLLDIVTFHSKMIFNPSYGRTGLIGFPYFLLFEILGPWFEAEGYVMLAASLALGAIGLPLFLLMFTATVLLGMLVSTASMIIAEHRRQYFPFRDKLILVAYAFLENFGFRQLMSLLRVRGFLRMLARVGGWGAMERRGLGS